MDRTAAEEYIFGGILLLANKLQVLGDGLLDDLTMKQWFLLMLISKMKKENPTINEISEFSGTSRQNVKKMLDQLSIKKYVKITRSDTDARALNVSLSQKTYKYFAENDKKGVEALKVLFSNITNEELLVTIGTFDKLFAFFGNPTFNDIKGEKK